MGIAGAPIPALLNSTSSRPKASLTFAKSARTDSGLLTSVGTLIIPRAHRRRLIQRLRTPPGERHVIARLVQRDRRRPPNPAPRTGHHRYPFRRHLQ